MTQKELEKYLMDAANILRGMIDAADFKQYIFPLLFFKRISDVWDEEFAEALEESGGDLDYAKFRENHRFQIPDGCHWEDVRKVTVDVGLAFHNAIRGLENANFELLHDIFGDAQWTNKRRISDEKMLDLIEHFSKLNLNVSNLPHDLMGEGYEYLIKKFADDSGHTAAEFYTNRTVVKLMTLITDPQPKERVYDPTCGSGGILLNSVLHLKEQGKEYRNVKLYGQELNLITAAIARVNMFMHNVDEFSIVQGDTLDSPQLLEDDELKRFDVVMANPPYSVKRWNQAKFINDPFGRNLYGTPPQGNADYAFLQHILKSLNDDTGRCIVLFPHGVLYRDAERSMRRKMVEDDLIEAVIGLGANLFYNSTMESCLLVCRNKKEERRKGKIQFINGVNEVARVHALSFLTTDNISRIFSAYKDFLEIDGFSSIRSNQSVLSEHDANLTITRYVSSNGTERFNVENEIVNFNAGSQETVEKILDFNEHLNTDELLKEFRKILSRIDRWKPFKFKELVNNMSKSVARPLESGIERFVGLEHLSADTFEVVSWGLVKDGTSFTKRFFAGNVLFSKRRSYLKKVGVADFDGICSGDILVFEVKPDKKDILLDTFLPYVVRSNDFIDYACYTSAGSLSPRTKWKEISTYEMQIPTIEEQQIMVDALAKFQRLVKNVSRTTADFDEKLRHLSISIMNDSII